MCARPRTEPSHAGLCSTIRPNIGCTTGGHVLMVSTVATGTWGAYAHYLVVATPTVARPVLCVLSLAVITVSLKNFCNDKSVGSPCARPIVGGDVFCASGLYCDNWATIPDGDPASKTCKVRTQSFYGGRCDNDGDCNDGRVCIESRRSDKSAGSRCRNDSHCDANLYCDNTTGDGDAVSNVCEAGISAGETCNAHRYCASRTCFSRVCR